MTEPPTIFSLIARAVIGELGPRTTSEQGPECPVCHRLPFPEYGRIEYVFDRWNGEDLVTAMRVLCVSQRLRSAIESANLTGVEFEPALVSRRADGFEIGTQAYAKKLPPFFHLRAKGVLQGPEIWATSKVCRRCRVRSWTATDTGLDAALAQKGEDMPLREVYRDSWHGEDIFDLEDRRRHVVTERFRQVMDSVNPKDARYGPAKWVER